MPDAVYSGRVGLQAAHHSGAGVAALRLWQSVGMVVHFRPGNGFEVLGLPPILHVRAWRNARGLERDDDFAFMFLSEEDAYAEGGAALAEAWLEVAGQAYERLMSAAVAVAEGPPVGRMLALNARKGRRAPAPGRAAGPSCWGSAAYGGPGGGADGLSCHEAVRGVDPGPQGGVGSFVQAAKHLLTFSERAAVINALKTRHGWKGLSSPSPSMWMSTLSFSTELQHRRGLWHH